MKKVALSSFILLLTFSAVAQTPVKLTFREAIEIGLKRNILLQQQRNQLSFTEMSKNSNLLQMTPSASINGSAGRFDGNSFNQQIGEVVNGKTDYINGNIGASIPLFNGFSQVNAFRQSKSVNDAQYQFVIRTEQDVIRNIASQYLTALLDQQLLKIDIENIETQKAQYNQIKEQVELGSRAEADMFNQEFQVKNAELLSVRSSNRLKNDLAILAQTLVIDPSLTYELEDPNWDLAGAEFEDVNLEDWNKLALQNRSDLKQADLNAKASQFGFYSARGRYLPNLSAFASLSSRYNFIFDFPDNRSFEDQFRKDNRQVNYGVQLTIPLFNGLIQRTQAAQARVTYDNAKLSYLRTEIQVKTDVLLAFQNYKDAKTSYQASDAQLRAAELSYRMEKERFELGISNVIQLTTTNQAYVRALSDYANARYTVMFQRLLVNYALGTLKIDDIPPGQ
jgi:outer membrane protein